MFWIFLRMLAFDLNDAYFWFYFSCVIALLILEITHFFIVIKFNHKLSLLFILMNIFIITNLYSLTLVSTHPWTLTSAKFLLPLGALCLLVHNVRCLIKNCKLIEYVEPLFIMLELNDKRHLSCGGKLRAIDTSKVQWECKKCGATIGLDDLEKRVIKKKALKKNKTKSKRDDNYYDD